MSVVEGAIHLSGGGGHGLHIRREPNYQPWLIEPDRLFAAMDTWNGKKRRGLLVIECALLLPTGCSGSRGDGFDPFNAVR